jgi:hypothetical protein
MGEEYSSIGSTYVECITLDDITTENPDFIKIDIEGAETLALKGCKNISKWLNTLFLVECHNTFEEVTKELYRLNKSYIKIDHPLPGASKDHCWIIAK